MEIPILTSLMAIGKPIAVSPKLKHFANTAECCNRLHDGRNEMVDAVRKLNRGQEKDGRTKRVIFIYYFK